MNCPTCHRKLARNAKVCPSCQHDFVAERRQKALVAVVLGALLALVAALIGLVLLSPGIIINTVRGRYRNRTRGLISSALRDWQTWVISLPFAVPVLFITVTTWNATSAERSAAEQRQAELIRRSETESREIASAKLLLDRDSVATPTKLIITDVSMKSLYSTEYGQYQPACSCPPPVVLFRDLPAFHSEDSNTVARTPMIDFDGKWVLRFGSASARDAVLRKLTDAVDDWRRRFPTLVRSETMSESPQTTSRRRLVESETSTREIARIPMVNGRDFVVTDVSVELAGGLTFFRDRPRLGVEGSTAIVEEGSYFYFKSPADRDKAVRILKEAYAAWQTKFAETVDALDAAPPSPAAQRTQQDPPAASPLSNLATPSTTASATATAEASPATFDSPPLSPPAQTVESFAVVVGIAAGDDLNVRAAPAMNSTAVFKLANGDLVQIRGESVYNGDTEWVPIALGTQRGWVRNKYLRNHTR